MSKMKDFILTVQDRLANGESSTQIANDLNVDIAMIQQIEHDYLESCIDDYPDTWQESE